MQVLDAVMQAYKDEKKLKFYLFAWSTLSLNGFRHKNKEIIEKGRNDAETRDIDRYNIDSSLKIKSVHIATILGPNPIEKNVDIKKKIATTCALTWLGAIIWMATGDIACWRNIINANTPSIIIVYVELLINGVATIIGIKTEKTIKAHLIGASL